MYCGFPNSANFSKHLIARDIAHTCGMFLISCVLVNGLLFAAKICRLQIHHGETAFETFLPQERQSSTRTSLHRTSHLSSQGTDPVDNPDEPHTRSPIELSQPLIPTQSLVCWTQPHIYPAMHSVWWWPLLERGTQDIFRHTVSRELAKTEQANVGSAELSGLEKDEEDDSDTVLPNYEDLSGM